MYRDVIRPAIDAADLAPIRADEEKVGSIIQKPMYERLLFCDYAVADLTGLETDWRDSYPGVNTVTLMELREPPDPRRNALLPVVRYAVDRKIATGSADYWDWATVVELEVLASHEPEAMDALAAAVGLIRETWEPETTARNIRLIRMARERRGVAEPWLSTVEHALVTRSQ